MILRPVSTRVIFKLFYSSLLILLFVAGSKFWHTGAFEVKKQNIPGENDNLNSVDVNISSDLNGLSQVQVRVLTGEMIDDRTATGNDD